MNQGNHYTTVMETCCSSWQTHASGSHFSERSRTTYDEQCICRPTSFTHHTGPWGRQSRNVGYWQVPIWFMAREHPTTFSRQENFILKHESVSEFTKLEFHNKFGERN